jgi:hypothetical protein
MKVIPASTQLTTDGTKQTAAPPTAYRARDGLKQLGGADSNSLTNDLDG